MHSISWCAEREVTAFCLGAFKDALCLRRQGGQMRMRAVPQGSAAQCILLLGHHDGRLLYRCAVVARRACGARSGRRTGQSGPGADPGSRLQRHFHAKQSHPRSTVLGRDTNNSILMDTHFTASLGSRWIETLRYPIRVRCRNGAWRTPAPISLATGLTLEVCRAGWASRR
jgi:hypothetical protein